MAAGSWACHAGERREFLLDPTALTSATSAAEFYAGDQWHNSGGDRTWLAPEVDFFFPKFPRPMSTGSHASWIRGTGRSVCACRAVGEPAHLPPVAVKAEVEMEMTKSVPPAPNPLRYERVWAPVRMWNTPATRCGLTLAGQWEQQGGPVGLWNLIQMPHGGDLLVPTSVRANRGSSSAR